MSEIKSLTGLRGIAALYVVLFHYVNFSPAYGPAWLTGLVGHGYISVDLFFVLSGFVIAMSYGRLFDNGTTRRTYAVFLGRRLARIYPLYLAVTLILVAAVLLGDSERLTRADLALVIPANLLMVQAGPRSRTSRRRCGRSARNGRPIWCSRPSWRSRGGAVHRPCSRWLSRCRVW